jgi:O-antigen/teichoic acid export membrane protein
MVNNAKYVFRKIFKSELIRDTASYSIINIIQKLVPFIILPILTRVLSKDDVGTYILYVAILELLYPILTLNLVSSIMVSYYKIGLYKFRVYFTNATICVFPILILMSVLLYLNKIYLSEFIKIQEPLLMLLPIIIMFKFFSELRQLIWRLNYKIKNYGAYSILLTICVNGLGLYLILYKSYGWESIVYSQLVVYFIFSMFSIHTFKKEKLFVSKLSIKYMKDAILVGYPLALHSVNLWLGSSANKFIIAGVLGTAYTGSFGVGSTFAAIVAVIDDSISKAYVPQLFHKLKNITDNVRHTVVKTTYYIYFILLLVSISIAIFGYLSIEVIYGSEYLNSKLLIAPLIAAAFFKGIYKLHVNFIHYTKKTLFITLISMTTGIGNIILAYHMTIHFGLVGAAYSLLIVNVIQYILTFLIGNKLCYMPWFYLFSKNQLSR